MSTNWRQRRPSVEPLLAFKQAMQAEAERLGCTPAQVFQAQYAENLAKRGMPQLELYLKEMSS